MKLKEQLKSITAEQLYKSFWDSQAWIFSKTNDQYKLDPWIKIVGVDKCVGEYRGHPAGSIIIELEGNKDFIVSPDYDQIFVEYE